MSALYYPWGLEPQGSSYRLYRLTTRPWAVIRDAEGFLEDRCNAYLLFAAWQDRSPRQVVADAGWLTQAATWMRKDPQGAWETMDLDRWAAFLQGIALDRVQRHQDWQRPVCAAVEALHRVCLLALGGAGALHAPTVSRDRKRTSAMGPPGNRNG